MEENQSKLDQSLEPPFAMERVKYLYYVNEFDSYRHLRHSFAAHPSLGIEQSIYVYWFDIYSRLFELS